jgi:hypothetical protein
MSTPYPRCLCGGVALRPQDLALYMEDKAQADYISSMVGPYGIYCPDEDDVLLEDEAWEVMGLKTKGHDLPEDWDDPFGYPIPLVFSEDATTLPRP